MDDARMSAPGFAARVVSEVAGAAVIELTITDRDAGSFPLPGQRLAWAHVLMDAVEVPFARRRPEVVAEVAGRLSAARLVALEAYPDAAPASAAPPRMVVRLEFSAPTLRDVLAGVPTKAAPDRLVGGGGAWPSGRRHRPAADWTFARWMGNAPWRKVPGKEHARRQKLAEAAPDDDEALIGYLEVQSYWPEELFERRVASASGARLARLVAVALDHAGWTDFRSLASVLADPRVAEALAVGVADRPTGPTQRMEAAQLMTLAPVLPDAARSALRSALAAMDNPECHLSQAPASAKQLLQWAGACVLDDAACRAALRALADDEKRALWLEAGVPLREAMVAAGVALPPAAG